MNNITSNITEILILLFLLITFLQSGFDKLRNWTGNLNFVKAHFSKTPLRNWVRILLLTILVVEFLAGILSGIGVFELIVNNNPSVGLLGAVTSCLALLMLLFGQRVAKDYAGALTITCYFIVAIFGVFLLNL
ncbi:MAG: DoxX family protein [Flavobacteriaceae bacterium]|nr:DoxX family protein [Flavobacteriaceae bacterium]MDZ4148369.1 DoxX family protein [Flavobacteriaceae bacterium]